MKSSLQEMVMSSQSSSRGVAKWIMSFQCSVHFSAGTAANVNKWLTLPYKWSSVTFKNIAWLQFRGFCRFRSRATDEAFLWDIWRGCILLPWLGEQSRPLTNSHTVEA
jgi:hypothetical protein